MNGFPERSPAATHAGAGKGDDTDQILQGLAPRDDGVPAQGGADAGTA